MPKGTETPPRAPRSRSNSPSKTAALATKKTAKPADTGVSLKRNERPASGSPTSGSGYTPKPAENLRSSPDQANISTSKDAEKSLLNKYGPNRGPTLVAKFKTLQAQSGFDLVANYRTCEKEGDAILGATVEDPGSEGAAKRNGNTRDPGSHAEAIRRLKKNYNNSAATKYEAGADESEFTQEDVKRYRNIMQEKPKEQPTPERKAAKRASAVERDAEYTKKHGHSKDHRKQDSATKLASEKAARAKLEEQQQKFEMRKAKREAQKKAKDDAKKAPR